MCSRTGLCRQAAHTVAPKIDPGENKNSHVSYTQHICIPGTHIKYVVHIYCRRGGRGESQLAVCGFRREWAPARELCFEKAKTPVRSGPSWSTPRHYDSTQAGKQLSYTTVVGAAGEKSLPCDPGSELRLSTGGGR